MNIDAKKAFLRSEIAELEIENWKNDARAFAHGDAGGEAKRLELTDQVRYNLRLIAAHQRQLDALEPKPEPPLPVVMVPPVADPAPAAEAATKEPASDLPPEIVAATT